MGGMGTAEQTKDTNQNSFNNALTNQSSLTQGLQQSNSNTLQNQMQSTTQNNNQATDQFQTNGQAQTSSTNPWEAAMPTVQGLMSQLNPMIANSGITPGMEAAFGQLSSNYAQGNPYAQQIGNTTNNMLNGGGATAQDGKIASNLDTYRAQLTPYANGSMVGNNPGLQAQLDLIRNDVGNSINSQFAAAGRDMSGANQQAYGRGVSQGMAPVIAAQYNQDVANQLGAAGSLYGAGNTTAGLLTGTNQQSLANQQAGIGNVPAALDAKNYGATQQLALEQMRQRLPMENLGLLANIGIPLAGLGSTSSGTAQGVASNTGNTTGSTTGTSLGSTSGNTNSTAMNTTLGQAISSLLASSASTEQMRGTSTPSMMSQIGQGIGLVGSVMGWSDRRLKEDIDQVGTLFDGTPVYRYRYLGQPAFQIGLMAQDIEKTTPEAVAEVNGFKAVDYKLATENALAEVT